MLQSSKTAINSRHALRGLRSLCDLGVLHPASTLPGILCVTVAGSQVAARGVARQLLLRMVENAAPLLAQRCGIALRMAAQQLGEVKEVLGLKTVCFGTCFFLQLCGFGFKVIFPKWWFTSECLLRGKDEEGNKEREITFDQPSIPLA